MQLQPFKRPTRERMQRTRTTMLMLRCEMADAYAWKNTMLQAAPSPAPRPGDLHPWDALVDGCL